MEQDRGYKTIKFLIVKTGDKITMKNELNTIINVNENQVGIMRVNNIDYI